MQPTGNDIPIFDDLYSIWYKPFWHEKWFQIVSFIFIVMVVGLVAWSVYKLILWYRWYTLPRWKKIVMQIEKLFANEYFDDRSQVRFYTELLVLIKDYFQYKTDMSFACKTEDEFLALIKKLDQHNEFTHMAELIDLAKYIKFGKRHVSMQDMKRDQTRLCQIIIAHEQSHALKT